MDGNKEHECSIGIWSDYHYSPMVTLNELFDRISLLSGVYSMKQYLDWRYNTNLVRFVYCPYCGKKIDWKELKKQYI